ncbi:MAG: DAK2 domain-containing protein [Anaerolineaceae bacterium]|jgi:DAK2 domain fusion protein YloV|nr:DAK2 domain-containing protein [Anaerolineaceae bacterium]
MSNDLAQPVTQLDGQGLKKLIEAGLTWLKTNQQIVNALNVFPVPDGDTGTNMLLTMQAAYDEIATSGEKNIGKMSQAIARGALIGARGNSGVILSQLWRGFARECDNLPLLDSDLLVKALAEARNTSYKGVVRPVEGTILTVGKDIAAAAAANQVADLKAMLELIIDAADKSVAHTPELLPILKQAGVVDSGGKGLFFILEGMLRYLNGESLDTALMTVQPLAAMQMDETMETVEPGQDYEVVVDFRPKEELILDQFYNSLMEMGTSIQVGEGDGIYRMHIHVPTDNRYLPIDYIMEIGTITKVYIENLIDQMEQIEEVKNRQLKLAPVEPGEIAVVTVSPGPGLSRIFASLGVAAIVEGGQTMNPSTKVILAAVENLPTDKVIILPNKKNIVMAAEAASTMTVKQVAVIRSTTVPQGLSAMLRLNPDMDFDTIVEEMNEALTDVETGEITIATRSVTINGVNVAKGQVIALHNGKLIQSTSSLEEACLGLLQECETEDRERITLYYGDNIVKTEVNQIVDRIRSAYPAHEIELHEGGQPHYQFIIAVE